MRLFPVSDNDLQTFTMPMEGQTIRVTLRWIRRTGYWSMDLARDGADILRGQRIVMGTNLLRAHNFGIGGILAVASVNDGEDPGRDDLGSRVQLVHVSEAEIAAAVSS